MSLNKKVVFKAPIEGFQFLQADALAYHNIVSGQTVEVPANTEYILTEGLTLVGGMNVVGTVTLLDLDAMKSPNIATITTNTTANNGHDIIYVDPTAGNVTITLPLAADRTRPLTVKTTVSTANSVTVDGNGTETLDGELTQIIPYASAIKIMPNTTTWSII